jgi:hypothetical protein
MSAFVIGVKNPPMNPLTLIGIVALFFVFAVAWHDESARDSGGETSRRLKTSLRQETKRASTIRAQSGKVRNA